MSVKGKHLNQHQHEQTEFRQPSPVASTSSDEATFLLNCSIFSSLVEVELPEQDTDPSNTDSGESTNQDNNNIQNNDNQPQDNRDDDDTDSNKTIEIEIPPLDILVDERQENKQEEDDDVVVVNNEISVIECSSDDDDLPDVSSAFKMKQRTKTNINNMNNTDSPDVIVIGEELVAPRPIIIPSDDCIIIDSPVPRAADQPSATSTPDEGSARDRRQRRRNRNRNQNLDGNYLSSINLDSIDAELYNTGTGGNATLSVLLINPNGNSEMYVLDGLHSEDLDLPVSRHRRRRRIIPYDSPTFPSDLSDTDYIPSLPQPTRNRRRRRGVLRPFSCEPLHDYLFPGESTEAEPEPSPPNSFPVEDARVPLDAASAAAPAVGSPAAGVLGKCPVCLEDLKTKPPASTFCGHVFCIPCLRVIMVSANKKCPTCRSSLKGKGYHPIYFNS